MGMRKSERDSDCMRVERRKSERERVERVIRADCLRERGREREYAFT